MKYLFALALVLFFACAQAGSQTVEDRIIKGKAALGGRDLRTADAHFAAALSLMPEHEEANVWRAITSLLLIPSQPDGSSLLTRLGFPLAGRDLYQWTAQPPRDAEGVPIAPPEVSASEATAFLRGTLLPQLMASEANLAQVVNTNFLMFLSRRETKFPEVFLDYGDVQMVRALLGLLQYMIYTAHSWNLDIQLSALSALSTGPAPSAEILLDEYPNLFTFSSTNDLFRAQEAFSAAVERYLAASAWIRARPPNAIRLFNWDLERADDEAQFRRVLLELSTSLSGPVVVSGQTNFSVHLARHFTGLRSPRSLLPEMAGDSFVAGTLPDPSLDGLIGGLTSVDAEWRLSQAFTVAPRIVASPRPEPDEVVMRFNTVTGRVYSVEFSTDLGSWIEITNFISTGTTLAFTEPWRTGNARGFYRLTDLTSAYVQVWGKVLDRCSRVPLPGVLVADQNGGGSTRTDASGNFFLQTRIPVGSFEDWLELEFAAPAYEPFQEWFYESQGGIRILLTPANPSSPPNDAMANATPLVGWPTDIVGSNCGATLEPGEPAHGFPPSLVSASVWWSWVAPAAGLVNVRPISYAHANYNVVSVFTRTPLGALNWVGFGLDEVGFMAEQSEAYWIAVSSYGGDEPGRFALRLQAPPTLTLQEPQDGAELTGDRVAFEFGIVDPDGDLERLEIVADGDLVGVVTNAPWLFTWENVPPGFHCFEIVAIDRAGNRSYEFPCLTVRPRNDNFADRIPIRSVTTVVVGSSKEATLEPDEPIHGGVPTDFSVWWSWRAPNDGPVTLWIQTRDRTGARLGLWSPAVAIYTGTELNRLSVVASNTLDEAVHSPLTSFAAVAGTEYQIVVADVNGQDFFLSWVPSVPPSVRLTAPETEGEYLAAASFQAAVDTEDVDGQVCRVDYYLAAVGPGFDLLQFGFWDVLENLWIGSSTNAPFDLQLGYLSGGPYFLWAEATDNSGLSAFSDLVAFEINEPPWFEVQPSSLFATAGLDLVLRPVRWRQGWLHHS